MKKNKNLQFMIFTLSFVLSLASSFVSAQNCPSFQGVKSSRQAELLAMVDNTTFQITVENRSRSAIIVKLYHSVDANPGTTAFSTHQIAARSSSKLTNLWYAGDWGIQVNNSCIRYLADVGDVGAQKMMTVGYGVGDEMDCAKYNLTKLSRNIDGVWTFEHSAGLIVHQATLYVSEGMGKVVTKFFDENTEETQTIEQQVMLCQSASGLMILGFRPMDSATGTTGESISYNADNFSMKRQPSGKFEIFNRDDSGVESKVDIKNFRELVAADMSYLERTYF
ncbi:hypothetical protein BH10ACI1_BH10ACI1_12310 [soil metagenome]